MSEQKETRSQEWLKIAGAVFAGVVAIGTIPFASYMEAREEANFLRNSLADIDSGQTKVFNSIAVCTAQGVSEENCKQSQKAALDFSVHKGADVKYNTYGDCAQKHRICDKYTETYHSGKTTQTTTTYHPPVIAWQVANDDYSKSVPLYPTLNEGVAVRVDGKEFNISPQL